MLRRVALVAAERFGLVVRDLALVLHAYNTTFRLDTDDGRRLALRVNTNSKSTPAHIAAQQAWLHALAAETAVRVPDPLAAPGGGWHVEVDCPQWGGPLHATVASWLDGDDVGQCDAEQARALGRTMAALHDHAEGFTLPAGAAPHPLRRAALPRRQPARGRRADARGPRRGGGGVARALPAAVRRGVRRAAPDRAARRPARRQPEVARGRPGGLRPRRRRLRRAGPRPGDLDLLPAQRRPARWRTPCAPATPRCATCPT